MLEETKTDAASDSALWFGRDATQGVPQRLDQIVMSENPRWKQVWLEFRRVLGGGVVSGSVVLIGGDPGIGKSTLLLQALKQDGIP